MVVVKVEYRNHGSVVRPSTLPFSDVCNVPAYEKGFLLLTRGREPELRADDGCIQRVPKVVTHCPILIVQTHQYSSIGVVCGECAAIIEEEVSIHTVWWTTLLE